MSQCIMGIRAKRSKMKMQQLMPKKKTLTVHHLMQEYERFHCCGQSWSWIPWYLLDSGSVQKMNINIIIFCVLIDHMANLDH